MSHVLTTAGKCLRGKRTAHVGSLAAALIFACAPVASSQFLRLGPFDVTAIGRVEGIYTTNVEQERPSEATEDREDYYIVTGLDLNGVASLAPGIDLNLDTGVAVERHANRSDLDNSENPFGRARLDASSELRHLVLAANAYMERTSESADDQFVPGGRKKRDVNDEMGYGASADWAWKSLALGASYVFTQERHDEVQFQDGDQDETTMAAGASWQFFKPLSLQYDFTREKTEEINQVGAYDGWNDTHLVGIRWDVLNRPWLRLSYTFAYEREDQEGEQGDWEPTHTIDIASEEPLLETDTLRLYVSASYSLQREEEEDDDIAFTYGVKLEHDLSRTTMQELWASREPYDTFGSTEDTEHTEVGYSIAKAHLFIYNLNAQFTVLYETDEPKGRMVAPVEKNITYTTTVDHTRALSRKLQRSLAYTYSYEDSNIEDEALLEHRVILSFEYLF